MHTLHVESEYVKSLVIAEVGQASERKSEIVGVKRNVYIYNAAALMAGTFVFVANGK